MPTAELLVGDPPVALNDAPDGVALFAATLEDGLRLFELLRRIHDDHADTPNDGAEHVVPRNIPDGLQVLEDRQHWPRMEFDDRAHALGEHARQVFGDASAGNVGHGAHGFRFDHAAHDGPVALVSPHQLGANLTLDLIDIGVGCVAGDLEEQLAG